MDRLFGLPAHPLIVHIPVAMLPLAAVGVLVMLLRRSWYERYKWAVLFVGAIGTVGAILAASSGEGLEKEIAATKGRQAVRAVHDHVEAGDLARTMAIVFFVMLALYVVVPWFLQRRADSSSESTEATDAASTGPRWLCPALMVGVAITAVVSMITIIDAGHSGAARAWDDYSSSSIDGG